MDGHDKNTDIQDENSKPEQVSAGEKQNSVSVQPSPKHHIFQKVAKYRIVVLVLAILVIASVGVWWIFLRDMPSAGAPAQRTNSESSSNSEIVPEEYVYSSKDYSTNPNGDFIELTQNGKTILSRSVYDWDLALISGNKIFFGAIDPKVSADIGTFEYEEEIPFTLHSYDFQTGRYKQIGELSSPSAGSYFNGIESFDESSTIGVKFGGYKSPNRTYQCGIKDDSEKCGKKDILYDGAGEVVKRGGQYYIVETFGDAGVSTYKVSSLDVSTGKTSVITEGGSGLEDDSVGTNYSGIDNDGCIWQYSTTVTLNEKTQEYSSDLIDFYCQDKTGKKVTTISATDVPITKPDSIYGLIDKQNLLIYNTDTQVSYNVTTKKYSNPSTFDESIFGSDSEKTVKKLEKMIPNDVGLELKVIKAEES